MDRKTIGSGALAIVLLIVAFLLPVTFPELTGWGLLAAWLATGLVAVLGLWLIWHKSSQNGSSERPRSLSVREHFDQDFGLLKIGSEITGEEDGKHITVAVQDHMDFDAGSDFFSAYIPRSKLAFELCRDLAPQASATR